MKRLGMGGFLVSLMIAFVVQVVLVLLTRVRLAGPADAVAVQFGLPLGWVVQDQTKLDPPYPWTARFQSPWEHPTDVLAGPMLINYALIVLAVYALAVIAFRMAKNPHKRDAHATVTG